MTGPATRRMSIGTVLFLAVILLVAGGFAAIWGLSRYPQAARFFGVAEVQPTGPAVPASRLLPPSELIEPAAPARTSEGERRVEQLEDRLARVETATARFAGSAGRADALLIAFAARRAIDRGVALGYLEPLLAERFGASQPNAVATIVTASRQPVRLDQLREEFAALGPRLKAPDPEQGVWQGLRRELGGLVSIRRADQPSARPSPTYDRAAARLAAGQVDQALAEAMRLPGIGAAPRWVSNARRYIAAHRALDQIESAALMQR